MPTKKSKYQTDNKTKLLEKLKRNGTLRFPMTGDFEWLHRANCGSSRFFCACSCEVQLRVGNKIYS
jgi:hypothetical protein